MKKNLYYAILALYAAGISACSFSVGTKNDMVSGLSSNWNGLSVETVYFVNQEDQSINNKQVNWNTECSFVFEGIEHYTVKNGNAFPGLTLTVTDPSGKEVITFDDMLADYTEGVSPQDAATLRATLTVGDPMQVGKAYKVTARVFDKQNQEAEIVSSITITVIE